MFEEFDDPLGSPAAHDALDSVRSRGFQARRRRVAALTTAAVVILAGVAAGVVGTHHDSADRLVPAPATSPAVVPWKDLPAGAGDSPRALPVQPQDLDHPACVASQLSATLSSPNGATGNEFYNFTIKRISGSPCVLDDKVLGLSGLAIGGGRHVLPIAQDSDPSLDIEAGLLSKPTDTGVIAMHFYPRCDTADEPSYPNETDLQLTLASGIIAVGPLTDQRGTPAESKTFYVGCLRPKDSIYFSKAGVIKPDPTYAHDPLSDLKVSLDATPIPVHGGFMRYTVTLFNPSSVAIPLDPCPNYRQSVDGQIGGRAEYELNCAQAGPVPAGGTEVFAMVIDANAPGRELSWSLDLGDNAAPGGPSASVTVPSNGVAPLPTVTVSSKNAPRGAKIVVTVRNCPQDDPSSPIPLTLRDSRNLNNPKVEGGVYPEPSSTSGTSVIVIPHDAATGTAAVEATCGELAEGNGVVYFSIS